MTDEVKCPHCGQTHTDLHEYCLEDGDVTTIECSCGRELLITLRIDYAYSVIEQEASDER